MSKAEVSSNEAFIDPSSRSTAHPELLGHAAATGHIASPPGVEASVFEQSSDGSAGAVTPAEPTEGTLRPANNVTPDQPGTPTASSSAVPASRTSSQSENARTSGADARPLTEQELNIVLRKMRNEVVGGIVNKARRHESSYYGKGRMKRTTKSHLERYGQPDPPPKSKGTQGKKRP